MRTWPTDLRRILFDEKQLSNSDSPAGVPASRRTRQALGGPVDWYFHLPLWLQTGCCGETLWACNPAHLAFIQGYVRVTPREHARGEHGWRNQTLRNPCRAGCKRPTTAPRSSAVGKVCP